MKKILFIFFMFYMFSQYSHAIKSNHGMDGFVQNVIDATTNARTHSNMGNFYFNEGNLVSAIKEYEIAYKLSYQNSSSSVYLYNLARCYKELNNYEQAKIYIEEAIKKDCINMTYYKALADCYVALKIEQSELERCLNDYSNPYNRIIAGLILLKIGESSLAKNIFDEFVNNNPDMIISDDVRLILKGIN